MSHPAARQDEHVEVPLIKWQTISKSWSWTGVKQEEELVLLSHTRTPEA